MEHQAFGKQILIRLDRGEDLHEALLEVQKAYDITLAYVTGIGAVNRAVVGTFDVENQAYHKKEHTGDMEIVNLAGNVSQMEGKPYLHLHAVLSNMEGEVFGGHLNEATISATGEIFLTIVDGQVDRAFNDEVGLNVFKFDA